MEESEMQQERGTSYLGKSEFEFQMKFSFEMTCVLVAIDLFNEISKYHY